MRTARFRIITSILALLGTHTGCAGSSPHGDGATTADSLDASVDTAAPAAVPDGPAAPPDATRIDSTAQAPDALAATTAPARGFTIDIAAAVGGEIMVLPFSVGSILVDSATLSLYEVYVASDRGTVDVRPGAVDLKQPAGGLNVRIPNAPPGLYSLLTLHFAPPTATTLPAVFQGQRISLRIVGRSAAGRPFVIADKLTTDVALRAADGVELTPGKGVTAWVRFNLEGWFDGIDFSRGGGTLDIDSGHNADLLTRFRKNFTQSLSLTLQ